MIKKISALLTALIMSAAVLTSCSNSDSSNQGSGASTDSNASSSNSTSNNSSTDSNTTDASAIPEPSLTIDGKAIDTKDLVMLTVDGRDVSFDMFRYYYYYVLSLYAQSYNITPESLASSEEMYNLFVTNVINEIKQDFVSLELADQYGIKLDEEDMKSIADKIAESKANYATEEEFQLALKSSCLTDDLYQKLMEQLYIYQKVEDELLVSGGKLATSKEDFKKIVQDTEQYSRVVHILIPYYSQAEVSDDSDKSNYESYSLYQKGNAKQSAYDALSEEDQAKVKEASKKLADEVLEKAKNGDDFDQLVREYGWDPGMESMPTGYYVNQNTSFVAEFKDMCFKLKENEISDLVENSSYGWFIIKRLPVDMEYVEKNIDSLITDYDTPRINKLYTDMIDKMEVTKSEYLEKLKPDSLT